MGGLAVLLAALTLTSAGATTGDTRLGEVFFILSTVASGLLFFRCFRIGITTDSAGLTVHGLMRNRRVSWPEVAGFGTVAESPFLGRGGYWITVETVDGRKLRTFGLLMKGGPSGRDAQRALAQLTGARAASRPRALRTDHCD